MNGDDLTIEILKGIRADLADLRGDLRDLRGEVVKTNERLDSTNARLETTNERLERVEACQIASEIRLATELVAVAQAVNQVRDLLKASLDVQKAVTDHERRILALESRPGH